MEDASGDRRTVHIARGLLLSFLASLTLLLTASAQPAYAVQSGPPDASGNWMYCNVGGGVIPGGSPSTNKLSVAIACQYGPTTLQVYSITLYTRVTRTSGGPTTQGWGGSGTSVQQGASSSVATVNKDGKYAETETTTIANSTGIDQVCVAQVSFGRNLFGGGTPVEIYRFTPAGAGDCITSAPTVAEADATYSGGAGTSYPPEFWSGGSSGAGDTFNGVIECVDHPTAPDCVEDTNPANPDGYELEECGAWYHIACHLRNALAKMFVPETLGSQFEDMIDTAGSHWPFAPIVWFFTTISDGLDAMQSGIESGDGDPLLTSCAITVEVPVIGSPGSSSNPDITLLDNCDTLGPPLSTVRTIVFNLSKVFILLAVFALVWRIVGLLTGSGAGGSGEGSE